MALLSKDQRKKLWKIKCEYRLKNPLFNLFYKLDPIFNGIIYGWLSLFFFVAVLTFLPGIKEPIGPKVLICGIIFGFVIYIVSYFQEKAWKEHKKLLMPEAIFDDVYEREFE
jgi:hypothetical protein